MHPRSLVQLVVQSLVPSAGRAVYGSVIGTEGVGAEQNTWPATDMDEYAYVQECKRDAARISPAAGYTFTARAASINASTLALLSAGTISILALPVAVALVVTTEGRVMLDPEADEEKQAKARFGFGWAWGAIFGTASEGNSMEVAGQSEGDAELVWVESEGNFTRQEVSPFTSSKRKYGTDDAYLSGRKRWKCPKQPQKQSLNLFESNLTLILVHVNSHRLGILMHCYTIMPVFCSTFLWFSLI